MTREMTSFDEHAIEREDDETPMPSPQLSI